MELIKKTILQKLITGTTATTTGTAIIMKPDLTVCYQVKIGIDSKIKDIGFFNSYSTGDTCCTCCCTCCCIVQKSVGFTDICYTNCACEQKVYGKLTTSPSMSNGDCFDVSLSWFMSQNGSVNPMGFHRVNIYCNNDPTPIRTVSRLWKTLTMPILDEGMFTPITVKDTDTLSACVCATTSDNVQSVTSVCIHQIYNCVGTFKIGVPPAETIILVAEPSVT